MALSGKVIVITGGARGMGRAHTLGFLEQGCQVVTVDLSWAGDGAEELRATVESAGGLVLDLDITNDDAIERFGAVDVLLNNAGMRQRHIIPPHGILIAFPRIVLWLPERVFD